MNYVTKNNSTVFIFIAVIAFVIFLIAQHRLVFPYHDDWGYAVLSYTTEQTGFVGRNFEMSNLIDFLIAEYRNWSGRVGAFFLEINLFKMGLDYVRAYQIISILVILFFSLRIPVDKKPYQLLLVIPIFLYLALPESIMVRGVYWYSAAAGYLWGIPFLLGAAYLIKKNDKFGLSASLLLAIPTLFHEIMGLVSISFILTYILLNCIDKKTTSVLYKDILLTIPVFLCAVITILSPGNFNRKSVSHYQSDNLIDIMLGNSEAISNVLFKHGATFALIVLGSFMIMSLNPGLFKTRQDDTRLDKNLIFIGLVVVILLITYNLYFSVLPIVFFSLYGFVLFKSCKTNMAGKVVLSLFVGSISSLVLLLLAPGVAGRALIPFYFIFFVPIIYSFQNISSIKVLWVLSVLVCVVSFFGIKNTYNIYYGYERNYKVNTVNHYKLSSFSFDIKNDFSTSPDIVLYKLPSPAFAETMPYQRPLIEKWMKKYYELPQDVNFIWRESKI